jgi:hypothetical protein
MITRWLTGFPNEVVKNVTEIKQSGVKCVDVETRTIVETATGKPVLTCFLVTFKGNLFQTMKARRIIDRICDSRR